MEANVMVEPKDPAPIRGIGVGALRRNFLVWETEPKPRKDEDSQVTAMRVALWTRYNAVKIDVRRVTRRVHREFAIEMEALEAKIAEVKIPGENATAEERREAARKASILTDEMRELIRRFCTLDVMHPRTGKTLGPVLARVHGVEIEDVDGEIFRLDSISNVNDVLDLLEELDLLETIGTAAMRAQDPTREQKN